MTVRANMVMLTERRKLGKSSISLPPLGFGCAPIGEIYDRITDEEARASFLCPSSSFRLQRNDVGCMDAVIYRVLVVASAGRGHLRKSA